MDRVILHSDINSCYVSVELRDRPELRGLPVVVGGDEDKRHGIVLAKSEPARHAGVKTGMTLWQARTLCPELITLKPHYDKYIEVSRLAQALYSEFTDRREPFGIDESWLDITGCVALPNGVLAAQEIRRRMKQELGVTVSVGVSWNKVFAKLGSDYKKPDAVTVIDRDNYQKLVWPLPISELLFVGPATTRILGAVGIRTIGELACADPELLRLRLGKNGMLLRTFAGGWDSSPVRRYEDKVPVKSVSNSTTPPHDLRCDEDVRPVLLALTEEVGGRLRKTGLTAGLLEIAVRYADSLAWRSHQLSLSRPTDLTRAIFETGFSLFHELHHWPRPLRGLGLRVSDLHPSGAPEQMDLFTNFQRLDGLCRIDKAVDSIREKYGDGAIGYLGSTPAERTHTTFCLKA